MDDYFHLNLRKFSPEAASIDQKGAPPVSMPAEPREDKKSRGPQGTLGSDFPRGIETSTDPYNCIGRLSVKASGG